MEDVLTKGILIVKVMLIVLEISVFVAKTNLLYPLRGTSKNLR
jgi:hypothetical protein